MEGCLSLSRRIRSFAGQYPLFFVSVILLDWTSGPVLFAKLLVFAEWKLRRWKNCSDLFYKE